MMETKALTVRQAAHKRILAGECRKDPGGIRIFRDKFCHLRSKFICHPHHRQKFPIAFRQRIHHGRRKHLVNIRAVIRQLPCLRKGT